MEGFDVRNNQIEEAREQARQQVLADLRFMRVYEGYRAQNIDKSEARRLALIDTGMLPDMAAPRRVRAIT